MTRENKNLLAFNRGVVSSRGLARLDVDRIAMSADTQTNYVPRVLGSMMLRPGFEYIDNTYLDKVVRNIPFVFSVDDTCIIEMSANLMRVRIDDEIISRPSVATTIANSTFAAGTDWTDISDTNGTVTFDTGNAKLQLEGNGTDFGRVEQQVTVAAGDQGNEHAVEVLVDEGPVQIKIGSASQADDYVSEARLQTGIHSLSFTPTGDFYVTLANERKFKVWVDVCRVAASGNMSIVTPYTQLELPLLRYAQSGDVIYMASHADAFQDRNPYLIRILRRGDGRSWSVENYLPEDGPFKVQNVSGITMTPGALSGDTTLTASESFFTSEHATHNSLFRLASNGQNSTDDISTEDTFTPDTVASGGPGGIRVVGSGDARAIGITITGTFSATVSLQFAFSADGPWNDTGQTWTGTVSTSYNDGQDDQVIYYRLGIKSGDYSSGTATCALSYSGGSIQGVCRVRSYTSPTVVNVQVLKDFGSTDATKDWWEGEWSERRDYPTAVTLHEGRLWWSGNDKIWGSVSDAYDSFDDNIDGDSAPISRSVGEGPIRVIHWMLPMARLLLGTSENSANIAAQRMDGNNPLSARSSSFDEVLTRSNFNIKTVSSRGVFVDRTKQRLYELMYDIDVQDYKSVDLSVFTPDFNEIGITQIAVQMKPDIRIHCVREDGTVGMLVYDRLENVICWVTIDSTGADGEIEDVAVLPGVVEDQVYYTVKRTINAGTERHLCKWAMESEAIGGDLNKIADSFVVYDSTATTTPFTTELLHLRDQSVEVWADGVDVGPLTVTAAGALTLTTAASKVVAGLGYTAQFKSAKLGEIIGLLERKKVNRIGFILENVHCDGLKYGPDFDNLYDLPGVEGGEAVADDTIHSEYHEDDFDFGGEWNPDSRICLQSAAPKPCTVLAAIADLESIEKINRR